MPPREQHLDAPRHDGERQGLEAERHHRERQQAERHDDRRDERRGEQVAEQRIGRHALEMVGGERRGREARRSSVVTATPSIARPAKPQEPVARDDIVVRQPRRPMVAPELPRRDQRGDRRERHLEAGLHDAFRLEREHDEGGDGKVAHRDRRPVDQDRGEHDERHHVGADASPRRRRKARNRR